MGWICGHLGSPSSTVPGDLGLGICCPCPVNPSPGTDGWACHNCRYRNPIDVVIHSTDSPRLLKGSHLCLDTKHFLPVSCLGKIYRQVC